MEAAIIVFRLPPKTKNKEFSKFCKRFYGQDTSSWGGKYHYHRRGLLDGIPHWKIIRGVVIIKVKDIKKVKTFLEEENATVYVWRVKLSLEEEKLLKRPNQ